MTKISITVSMTYKEAGAFSEFLKRASFVDYRNNAASNEEAYLMQSAGNEIKKALAQK